MNDAIIHDFLHERIRPESLDGSDILALLNGTRRVQDFLVDKVTTLLVARGLNRSMAQWDNDWDGSDNEWLHCHDFLGKIVFKIVTSSSCGCCSDEEGHQAFSLDDLLSPDFVERELAREEANRELERVKLVEEQRAAAEETRLRGV